MRVEKGGIVIEGGAREEFSANSTSEVSSLAGHPERVFSVYGKVKQTASG